MSPALARPPAWVDRATTWCGLVAAVVGTVMVVGWVRHFGTLGDTWPALPATKFNAGVAVAVAGISLIAVGPRERLGRWLALVPAAIGILTVVEWLGDVSLGIDELLVHDPFGAADPGRPSPQIAVALVLFAAARVTAGARGRRTAVLAGFATTLFVALGMTLNLGFLYRAPEITSTTGEAGMSAPGALAITALVGGILTLNAERRPLLYLWDRGPTGTVVRRLLPTVVVLIPFLGYLRLVGEEAELFGPHLGITLFVASMMAVLVVVVTMTAATLVEVEEERTRVTRELAAIFDSVPALLTLRDVEGRVVRMNRRAELTGSTNGRVIVGELATDNYPARIRDDLIAQDEEVLATGEPSTRGYQVETREGLRDWEITRFTVNDTDGSVLGVGGFTLDVTARREAERAAEQATARLRSYLDSAPDATVVVDESGTITYANHQVTDLLGYEPNELIGRSVDLLVPDAVRAHHGALREAFTANPHRREMGSGSHLSARHVSGRAIPVEVSLGPIPTDQGVGIAAAIRDVTLRRATEIALRQAEQRARHLADHDPLTGTFNRRRFDLELGELLRSRPAPGEVDAAVLIVDIDHFKSVNDTAGHQAGDQLLTDVAAALGDCTGRTGSLSRLGGDEFALLVHGHAAQVAAVADEALQAVCRAAQHCDLGDERQGVGLDITASIGIAMLADLEEDDRTKRAVMRRADTALYAAKNAGRGRHMVYDDVLDPGLDAR